MKQSPGEIVSLLSTTFMIKIQKVVGHYKKGTL